MSPKWVAAPVAAFIASTILIPVGIIYSSRVILLIGASLFPVVTFTTALIRYVTLPRKEEVDEAEARRIRNDFLLRQADCLGIRREWVIVNVLAQPSASGDDRPVEFYVGEVA